MSSAGITSLNTLLASISPSLNQDEIFVFATVQQNPFTTILSPNRPGDFEMFFREKEGWTLILDQKHAEKLDLEAAFPCRKITLNVHSSLDAVGFLAAVTTRIAQDVGVGVNPVSGFYHDHLFVPEGREWEVMNVLRVMAEEAGEKGESK